MSWTRRTIQMAAAATVLTVWAGYYLALITAGPMANDLPPEAAAAVNRQLALLLAIPTTLWVVAVVVLVHHWWSRRGAELAATDPPGRLLAAAVALLPEQRHEWGVAMTAELIGVQGRSARWRFALSSARAALWTPPPTGWPVVALVTGGILVSVIAAGLAVGTAVPGLSLFAVSFAGLVAALVVLAVARSRPLRPPVTAPTSLLTAGVAAAIILTAIFLRSDPTAADYLSPLSAGFLAAMLAGCLWVALVAPSSLVSDRLASYVGTGLAVVYAGGLLLLIRTVHAQPIEAGAGNSPTASVGQQQLADLAFQWLLFGLAVTCCCASLLVGSISRSFRSGLRAGVWAGVAAPPLAYAVWLQQALALHPVGDGPLFLSAGGPTGANLSIAVASALVVPAVLGLPFAAIGAALGVWIRRPHAVAEPRPNGTTISL